MKIIPVLHLLQAVSYTHLDVYKRQFTAVAYHSESAIDGFTYTYTASIVQSDKAVSYTHLDVYKRQRSCSGFHTLPDYSFETLPNDYAALVLIGGFGWLDELEADKVVPIVRRAIKKGIIAVSYTHLPVGEMLTGSFL